MKSSVIKTNFVKNGIQNTENKFCTVNFCKESMPAAKPNTRHIYRKKIREMNNCELKSCLRVLRLRQARRQKAVFGLFGLCAAFCIVFICAVFWSSVKTSASDGFKYYTGVTIESGDTLWKLADDYIDYEHYKTKEHYIAEIIAINHLDENCDITVGQLLVIPYYSDTYIR